MYIVVLIDPCPAKRSVPPRHEDDNAADADDALLLVIDLLDKSHEFPTLT